MSNGSWKSCLLNVILVSCFGFVCVWSLTVKTVRRRSHKCDYTLLVQEFDPSLCPSISMGSTQNQGSFHGTTTRPTQGSVTVNSTTGRSTNYFDGMIKEQPKRNTITLNRDGLLTNALNEMVRKIEELEAKLQSTISNLSDQRGFNEKLNARIEDLEAELKNLAMKSGENQIESDSNYLYLRQNLSRVADNVADLGLQKTYWKSVDNKLAGLMLDMTETNQVLTKHNKQLENLGVNEKVIAVQSTTDAVGCNISPNSTKYRDCEDYYMNGHTKSGVYYVTSIYSSCPIPVYCDMDTPPGGWLVLQRRQDGSLDFNRNWTDYRSGFGNIGQEFWIGLDSIFLLTNQKNYEARFDLWDFYGSRVHATYGRFYIDGERDGYRMHIANHSGSVPDGMQHHNEILFSTPDRDQDTYPEYHCAKEWGAGWWFANCWFVIVNGQYYNHTQVEYRGISWNEWKNEQLKKTEIKIRPSTL